MTTAGSVCPAKMMYIPNMDSGYAMLGLANACKNGSLNPSYISGITNSAYGGNSLGGYGGYYSPWFYPIPGFGNNIQRVRNWEEGQNIRANNIASSTHAKRLSDAIAENQTSLIPIHYRKFVSAIENEEGYKALQTEAQRQAYKEQAFSNISGMDLETAIDEGANTNFVSGLMNGATLGIARDKSADTLKNELLDIPKPRGADASNFAGRIIGGAITGAIIGHGVFSIPAAIVGGVIGGLSSLWS